MVCFWSYPQPPERHASLEPYLSAAATPSVGARYYTTAGSGTYRSLCPSSTVMCTWIVVWCSVCLSTGLQCCVACCCRGSLPDIKLGTAGITTTPSSTTATVNGYQPAPSPHVNSRAAHPGVSKYSSFVHHTSSGGRNRQTSAGGSGGGKQELSYTSDVEGTCC